MKRAGKTTTFCSIVGAKPPEVRSGTITSRGEDVTNDSLEDRSMRGIGIVPEERRVFAGQTVEENLQSAQMVRSKWNTIFRSVGSDRDDGWLESEIYDLFPVLEERKKQKAGSLSGGEQQMLAIARTLRLPHVDLLMLNEPTEGLARQIVDTVVDAIEDIVAHGKTVLLVEQNVKVALELTERCYILENGSIVHDGPTDELEEDEDLQREYLGYKKTIISS